MIEPNNDEVICPNCATQFRAIPVNIQAELAAANASLKAAALALVERDAEIERLKAIIADYLPIAKDSVAEINELRAELARLNEGWHKANGEVLGKALEIGALRAENQKLREALNDIAEESFDPGAVECAREALTPKEKADGTKRP